MFPLQLPPLPPPPPVPVEPVNAPPVIGHLVVGRTRISYGLSETARVTFTVEECVRIRRKPCAALVPLAGRFGHFGLAGMNQLPVPRKIGGQRLRPGRYRLSAQATDARGARSAVKYAPFVV